MPFAGVILSSTLAQASFVIPALYSLLVAHQRTALLGLVVYYKLTVVDSALQRSSAIFQHPSEGCLSSQSCSVFLLWSFPLQNVAE
jgi:hypothetical protein